jgi:hypothetical protein
VSSPHEDASNACYRGGRLRSGIGRPLPDPEAEQSPEDFDWAGLRIAGAVIARCGAVPWRFGAVDYEAAVGSFAGPSDALPRLGGAPAASPWDPALAAAMAARGVAVHEETVIATLLADLAPPE